MRGKGSRASRWLHLYDMKVEAGIALLRDREARKKLQRAGVSDSSVDITGVRGPLTIVAAIR